MKTHLCIVHSLGKCLKGNPCHFQTTKTPVFFIWNFYWLVSLHQNTLFQDTVFPLSQIKLNRTRFHIKHRSICTRGGAAETLGAILRFTCHPRTSSTSPRRTWLQPDKWKALQKMNRQCRSGKFCSINEAMLVGVCYGCLCFHLRDFQICLFGWNQICLIRTLPLKKRECVNLLCPNHAVVIKFGHNLKQQCPEIFNFEFTLMRK